MKLGRMYRVRWIDHFQVEDSNNKAVMGVDPVWFDFLGYYIGEDDLHYTLAYNYNPVGNCNDYMKILKLGVSEIKELEEKWKKDKKKKKGK